MGRVSRILKSPLRPSTPLVPGRLGQIGSRYVEEDLGRVVAAWPHLPQHLRLTVMTLVETAEAKREAGPEPEEAAGDAKAS